MEIRTCEYCTFFENTGLRGQNKGVCRRLPPRLVKENRENISVFPEVNTGDHCGEWAAADNLPRGRFKIDASVTRASR